MKPSYTELPTNGAWVTLRCSVENGLHVSQMDVDTCFHQMGAPPGMQNMFMLPAVSQAALANMRPDLMLPPCGSLVVPRLLVLPMYWA